MATDRKMTQFRLPTKTREQLASLAARWSGGRKCTATDALIHCVDCVSQGDFAPLVQQGEIKGGLACRTGAPIEKPGGKIL